MLQVGRTKGWEIEDLTTLFQSAIAFDPEYYYYYQEQALSLTPKWRGKAGDAEKFAEESANQGWRQSRKHSLLADRAIHFGQPRSRGMSATVLMVAGAAGLSSPGGTIRRKSDAAEPAWRKWRHSLATTW